MGHAIVSHTLVITLLFYHILPLSVWHIGPLEPLLMRHEGSLLAYL